MRAIPILVALAGCGSIDEPIHDVIDCKGGGRCERACADPNQLTRSADPMCNITAPDGSPATCPLGVVDVYMGTRGCCVPSDGVSRFFECE